MTEQPTQNRVIEVENKCMICGTVIGKFEVPVGKFPAGTEITLEMLGVEDSRCDQCTADHGSYQDMERIFKRDVSDDHDLFKQYVEAGERKLDKFYRKVVIDFPDELAGKTHKTKAVEDVRVQFETDAGLTALQAEQKPEAIKAAKDKGADLTLSLDPIKQEAVAIEQREAAAAEIQK